MNVYTCRECREARQNREVFSSSARGSLLLPMLALRIIFNYICFSFQNITTNAEREREREAISQLFLRGGRRWKQARKCSAIARVSFE
jgi:hypothetical protein